MGLVGVSTMKVGVDSQVKWGNTKMRVALVLDTTGSMNDDGKIDALKTATKNLLTQLQAAATTNGDVYVSIIPFSKDVNVGKSNYNADLDRLDPSGTMTTATTSAPRPAPGQRQEEEVHDLEHTGCRQPQHLERLRDRPRPRNQPHSSNYDTNVAPPSTSTPGDACSRPNNTTAVRRRSCR